MTIGVHLDEFNLSDSGSNVYRDGKCRRARNCASAPGVCPEVRNTIRKNGHPIVFEQHARETNQRPANRAEGPSQPLAAPAGGTGGIVETRRTGADIKLPETMSIRLYPPPQRATRAAARTHPRET
jgi:hypothetical protein